MILIRVFLVFALAFLSNYAAMEELFRFSEVQVFGLASIGAAISLVSFIYAKLFLFMRFKTKGVGEGALGFLVFPCMTIYMVPIVFLGKNFFDVNYLVLMAGSVIFCMDPHSRMSKFLWGFRFHEFRDFPDDGVVSERVISKYGLIALCTAFFIPVCGFFFGRLY